MKAVVFAVVLLIAAAAYAQIPVPCTTPFQWESNIFLNDPSKQVFELAEFFYDALGQRMATYAKIDVGGKKHRLGFIEIFESQIGYEMDFDKNTCKSYTLNQPFRPVAIPQNATLLGAFSIGLVLDVYTWAGQFAMQQGGMGYYQATVTEQGCIPVAEQFESAESGFVAQEFVNVVIGLTNPDAFIPASFCDGAAQIAHPSARNYLAKRHM
eukprot:c40608_g1_i1.p1 GENE.c40608_g1_i1~~c40608_g1_i1.p1  ORF type:complete len:223 (+),score=50.86 c40608_g1_i1:37-669(+)